MRVRDAGDMAPAPALVLALGGLILHARDTEGPGWAAADGSGCTCKGFAYRGQCSHVLAVREYLKVEQIMAEATAARQPAIVCKQRGRTVAVEVPGTRCAGCTLRPRRGGEELGI